MGSSAVLVVDDHPILRHGIAELINREPDLAVEGEASSTEEALALLAQRRFDLAVVDISMDGLSGLELLKTLHQRHPSLQALVLSMHDEALYAERALRAGARGYLMKQEATKKIIPALRQIRDGDVCLSDRMRQRLLLRFVDAPAAPAAPPLSQLTDRELEIFRLIGRGMKTGDIALALHRSVNTIEAHRASLKRKLGVASGAELARIAFQAFDAAGAAPNTEADR